MTEDGDGDAWPPRHATPWANLGLWTDATRYPEAAAALADAVAGAGGLREGDRVLGVACGAGVELHRWVDRHGAASALGIERDETRVREAPAHRRGSRVRLLAGDAMQPPRGRFDVVLCVDAAYHLSPRRRWLQAMAGVLAPGGRIAFTDLVLARPAGAAMRRAAAWCGIDARDLLDLDGSLARLRDAGFVDAHAERLDDEVLGGFARHVLRRGAAAALGSADGRRAAATALLVPACRAAGLGYALFGAVRG